MAGFSRRVGMEAPTLELQIPGVGRRVCSISPQSAKPYVKSNKNDFNDAEAIGAAVSRLTMRFIHPKTIGQQDLQALHRIRQRRIHHRTALIIGCEDC